jgi:ATP-dependent RNA helicase RhlE
MPVIAPSRSGTLPMPREGHGVRSPSILAPLGVRFSERVALPDGPGRRFVRTSGSSRSATLDNMTFTSLRLSEPILRAIADEGYERPSPIQAGVIPMALEGRDILGTAQTGTGKTAAFALPILHRLMAKPPRQESSHDDRRGGRGPKGPPRGDGRPPRALVLCPTRELAAQIHESFIAYGRHLPLRHAVIFGGVGQGKQVNAIRRGIDALIATPGRLKDLLGQSLVDLSRIETVVLDEADRMLDMGFIHDIRRIMSILPDRRQTMLLSATISKEIRVLADDFLHDPAVVETAPESTTAELVDQRLYLVERNDKPTLLIRLFEHGDMARTLVFVRTKHGADKLARILKKAGVKVEAIHGNKTQGQRTRAMDGFRSGKVEALVATDLAARGIDVDGVSHVVNFDLPDEPESYVHRIGRTARAGASGFAVSFCDRHEIELLRAIEKRTDARPRLARDHADLTYPMPADGGRSAAKAMREKRAAAQANRSSRRPRDTREASTKDGSAPTTATPKPKPAARSGPKPDGKPGAKPGFKPKFKPKFKPRKPQDGPSSDHASSGSRSGGDKPRGRKPGGGGGGSAGGGGGQMPRRARRGGRGQGR